MVAIAAMWKQVLGVETELVNQEWKVMLSNFTQGNVEKPIATPGLATITTLIPSSKSSKKIPP